MRLLGLLLACLLAGTACSTSTTQPAGGGVVLGAGAVDEGTSGGRLLPARKVT